MTFRLLPLACLACLAIVPCRGEDAVHLLRSGAWTAEVMDPSSPDRYYRGERFASLAGVLQVSGNGRTFCSRPEPPEPASGGGAGLLSEFDMASPPGFREAPVGGEFVKIGVGVLRKREGKYRFGAPQEVVSRAPVEAEWGPDAASFSQRCGGAGGYAYALAARVRLRPGRLSVDWALTNTGTRRLATCTYAHNFFQFADPPREDGYEIAFPYWIHPWHHIAWVYRTPWSIRFEKPRAVAINITVPCPPAYRGPNRLVVTGPGGLAVRCETSLPAEETRIYADPLQVCPEQFVAVRLEPGETARWTRSYRFQAPGGGPGR